MEKNQSIKYFPGLNALRFFAASLVIFHHVEQYKNWVGLPNLWGNPVIDSMGHQAVSFFFVLSGFLITYLLLTEKEKKGAIHLGRFYLRRALRIWPLYFLIVFVALLLLPNLVFDLFGAKTYGSSVVISLLLFLPNLLRIIMPQLVGANQLWSVGIEEQFYLIWPVLISIFAKRIVPFLLSFITLKFIINISIVASLDYIQAESIIVKVKQFLMLYELFPVEQMAIGGLGAALIYLGYGRLLKIIYHPLSLFFSLILLTVLSFLETRFVFSSYLDAVLFIVIIMNICHHSYLHRPLEWKLFKHLGDISYGIYMWHTIVIALILKLIYFFELTSQVNLILHLSSFIITLLVAHLSYQYFEKPFLKLKEKCSFDRSVFTVVVKE